MTHLILASHGQFSEALKNSAEMIMGPQDSIHAITLEPQEGPEDFKAKFEEVKAGLDNYIVFTDLSGGTPNNVISRYLLEGDSFPLYAGMNLPMVIGFINGEMIGDDQVDYVKAATDNVVDINKLLGK